MFQRRGVAVAGVVGAVVLLAGGCGGGAAGKGAAPAPVAASASASAPASAVMPAVVGQEFAAAEALVRQVVSTPVSARGAYAGVVPAPDHGQWEVCFQNPAAGAPVTAGTAVELSLVAPGTPCPATPGAPAPSKSSAPSKAPSAPAPAPATAKPKPATEGPTDGSTGGSGAGGSAYYKNCDAAKAAGAAPIRRGQPGYREALDRDKDGIACDK